MKVHEKMWERMKHINMEAWKHGDILGIDKSWEHMANMNMNMIT